MFLHYSSVEGVQSDGCVGLVFGLSLGHQHTEIPCNAKIAFILQLKTTNSLQITTVLELANSKLMQPCCGLVTTKLMSLGIGIALAHDVP